MQAICLYIQIWNIVRHYADVPAMNKFIIVYLMSCIQHPVSDSEQQQKAKNLTSVQVD
ncbi:hypothetical protein KP79_PYT17040 [Mizuhopecten yessoensis]|uniref:Uncharacterized protein n=1 Tax=Mizuhopecten yessoensis TaxID=6573 RepID=A0A210R258_MIZYE|nr:hypothetical protein KP79_PYT17040 [Mizuhopecten yessoensis]